MPSKSCLTCGEEFSVVESRADNAKFCSRECYHEGQRQGLTEHSDRRVEYETVECNGCGKEVEKPPSRANRSERQFCSQECYLDWSSSHQEDQTGRRQRLREKEDKSCEMCGFDRFVELSHIVASEDGGTYHKNNILFLCPNHHRLFDHGGLEREELLQVQDKLRLAICKGYGWMQPEDEQSTTDLSGE